MTFNLFLAILANIVYMLVKFVDLLLFVVVYHVWEIDDRLFRSHWVMR